MAQAYNSSLKYAATHYFRVSSPHTPKNFIENLIEENPHYPSLLSLSESFDRLQISNNAYEVTAEELLYLSPPFVAFVEVPRVGGDFITVTSIDETRVGFLYKHNKVQVQPLADFLLTYRNIVWTADLSASMNNTTIEREYSIERRARMRKVYWSIGLAILLVLLVLNRFDGQYWLAFLGIAMPTLLGVALTATLLTYEFKKSASIVSNLCSTWAKTNCDAVLDSRHSRIGRLSWSEIGLLYFSTITLWLFYPGADFGAKIPLLALSSVAAISYVPFSIYYQWRIVKQWCLFCLLVQALLVAEFIWGAFFFTHFFPWNWRVLLQSWPIAFICILTPILLWYAIKPILKKASEAGNQSIAYKRLLNNTALFQGFLQQQAPAPPGWQDLGILIGNPSATHTIVKVCNPYCAACAKAHPKLQALSGMHDDVNVRILFGVRNNPQDLSYIAVHRLLTIASQNDSVLTAKALSDWYGSGMQDPASFFLSYPVPDQGLSHDDMMESMRSWVRQAEVMHTPSYFVNGYRLPEFYNIEDLAHLL